MQKNAFFAEWLDKPPRMLCHYIPQKTRSHTKEVLGMFCLNCGKECSNNMRFCDACGAPLNRDLPHPACNSPSGYRAPIRRRNVGIAILLSLLTCGLYSLYWFICLVNDLNTASGRPQDPSGAMVFLLSLLTCGIYSLFWIYTAGEKISKIKRKSGAPDSNQALLYLLLWLIGFCGALVDLAIIQSELNQVAADA